MSASISTVARVQKRLRDCAVLAESGRIDGRVLALFLRQYAEALEAAGGDPAADQIDAHTIDLPMVTALCRQILAGRVREIRPSAVVALAGTALVLAARVSGKEVRA